MPCTKSGGGAAVALQKERKLVYKGQDGTTEGQAGNQQAADSRRKAILVVARPVCTSCILSCAHPQSLFH